jgi:hypothetical protein
VVSRRDSREDERPAADSRVNLRFTFRTRWRQVMSIDKLGTVVFALFLALSVGAAAFFPV